MGREGVITIDTHAHLQDARFDGERDAVLARAHAAGVSQMIAIGTSVEESRAAVACAQKYDGVFASVGLHPHVFNGGAPRESEWMVDLGADAPADTRRAALARAVAALDALIIAHRGTVVAVGECGLDYYAHDGGTITPQQRAWQREGFAAQIALAVKHNLPVVVHGRGSTRESMDAYQDIAQVIAQHPRARFVLHCYMGDVAMTQKFLTLPQVVAFSFAGNVTYAKKNTPGPLDDVLRIVPPERMMVETDAPYLAPVPHRGARNESAFVVDTLAYIAGVRGEDGTALGCALTATAQRVFALG